MLDRGGVYGDPGFWVRQAYVEGIKNRTITAVVRLGDRSDPTHKNHIPAGVPLPIRFIAKPAAGELGKLGSLLPDDGTTFRRTDCIVKPIEDLTMQDLRGMAPDCANPELIRYHLAAIVDGPLPSWDTVVTVWRFEYLPDATE